jgi:hypothetical protein
VSDAITAVADDGSATIAIDVDSTPVANGDPATWAEGENIVTITVTSGSEIAEYKVYVTKS